LKFLSYSSARIPDLRRAAWEGALHQRSPRRSDGRGNSKSRKRHTRYVSGKEAATFRYCVQESDAGVLRRVQLSQRKDLVQSLQPVRPVHELRFDQLSGVGKAAVGRHRHTDQPHADTLNDGGTTVRRRNCGAAPHRRGADKKTRPQHGRTGRACRRTMCDGLSERAGKKFLFWRRKSEGTNERASHFPTIQISGG
jgi:hypothetical protein